LIAFPVNAQQLQQQRLRELDREYEEAVYFCKLLVGEPGSTKRWSAALNGVDPYDCVMKRLGLKKPGQSVDVNVNRR
jgi:hypothetical protein